MDGMRKKRIVDTILKYKYLYIMLIPGIVWYIMFTIKPLYYLQIAFKDFNIYKGVAESPWVGFDHFIEFFNLPYFSRLIKNTILINLYELLFGFTAQIILALMLNEVRSLKFKKAVQTVTYLPHFISVVIIAGIVTTMLSPNTGVINLLIQKLGGESTYFLTKPEYFRTIYTTMNMWCSTGFETVVYMAALSSIDPQLYEACAIDGGGKIRQIFHITLPGILPTIAIMLIMRIGNILKVGYESIILLYQPATYETADVISTFVYRLGFEGTPRYDLSAAVDIFNSVIGVILVVVANKVSKRLTDSSLW